MHIEDCEELIQTEAEQAADDLFGAHYYDLSPDMRLWLRERVIESLWAENGEINAAIAA